MSDKICSQGHLFIGALCKRCGGGSSAPFILEEEVLAIPASVPEGSLPPDDLPKDEPEPKGAPKRKVLKITKMKKVRK